MDRALDRSLDDILEDRKQPFRDDAPRNLDSEWVHDRFEDYGNRRSGPRRRYSPEPSSDSRGSKLRVDNIHYELTKEDLEVLTKRNTQGLFSRIGPLVKLEMKYDRAGRSEGTAFVTYESSRDAAQAIKEFDGANAAGQPIRLTLLPSGPSGGGSPRNPFDSAVIPGRPLAERITVPGQRSRSLSPRRESDEEAARRGVDRYRPRGRGGGERWGGGGGRLSRSRSPMAGGGRRRDGGGRRPGTRREGGGGGSGGGGGGRRGERGGREGRQKKTQEELDAEMDNYFAGGGAQQGEGAAQSAPQQDAGEDVDMIE
ncbi:hypothetical protein NEMBOFW57_002580 [Staphylotrichum longicolle]|uniref:RRM domain-containing protein n=1 Tax=Staphylotrichum longicolle TaxID=669026 RepID=A0AAD4I3S4_9PEZI|nr:hypothetical protein NEMBOFW57_002580 [Staphylotrichum longicolle]